jgi:alcohol dehydrogenase YqhD (iron-dependent ADH family)
VLPGHESRFARFAVNVMGVDNDFTNPERTALKGIEAMEQFYHAIGMPVGVKELIGRTLTDDEIKELARKASRDGKLKLGNIRVLERPDMEEVFRLANF